MTNKTMTIGDILFTDKMRADAIDLYTRFQHGELHRHLVTLIEPHMPEIDKRLGQKNDVGYMAYAVEYALTQAGEKR